MSKLLAILLSTVITLQSVNINIADVLNIGELIEHAQEHKEEFGDNFFQFIAKHYGIEKALHAGHEDHQSSHENLPFQQNFQLSFVFVLDLNSTSFSYLKDFPLQNQQSLFFYNTPSSNVFVSGIFQPPRLA
ncbi:hypothetical protein [Paucihalobacter sp.]|uniref:hypothetical protein n=1 Tax=Paucihalobacter sp. TaxID=2850405 RepID=UPI002FDF1859